MEIKTEWDVMLRKQTNLSRSRVETIARDLNLARRSIRGLTKQIEVTQAGLHQLHLNLSEQNERYQALLRELDKSSSLSA